MQYYLEGNRNLEKKINFSHSNIMSDLVSALRILVLPMKDRQLLQGVIKEVTGCCSRRGLNWLL